MATNYGRKEEDLSKNEALKEYLANNIKTEGAGFQKDTNVITMISRNFIEELPLLSKFEAANKILDEIIQLSN